MPKYCTGTRAPLQQQQADDVRIEDCLRGYPARRL